jgi:hypothetical protein
MGIDMGLHATWVVVEDPQHHTTPMNLHNKLTHIILSLPPHHPMICHHKGNNMMLSNLSNLHQYNTFKNLNNLIWLNLPLNKKNKRIREKLNPIPTRIGGKPPTKKPSSRGKP